LVLPSCINHPTTGTTALFTHTLYVLTRTRTLPYAHTNTQSCTRACKTIYIYMCVCVQCVRARRPSTDNARTQPTQRTHTHTFLRANASRHRKNVSECLYHIVGAAHTLHRICNYVTHTRRHTCAVGSGGGGGDVNNLEMSWIDRWSMRGVEGEGARAESQPGRDNKRDRVIVRYTHTLDTTYASYTYREYL